MMIIEYKKIFGLLVLMSSLACQRVNSEFDIPSLDRLKAAKPTCQFEPQKNCWMEDLEVLQSCGDNSKITSPGLFTDNYFICDTYEGKKIQFLGTTPKIFEEKVTGPVPRSIEFIMYAREKLCFSFKGTENNFSIRSEEYGELSYQQFANGEIQVQCFSGEILNLNANVSEEGCENTSQEKAKYVPRLEIFGEESKSEDVHWTMRFLGLGDSSYEVFRCQ